MNSLHFLFPLLATVLILFPHAGTACACSCANRVARGDVCVIGIPWHFPSNRVDWLFNPTLAKPPFNPEWTWQLNRMTHWQPLADAYRATRDGKYARAFATQLEDWLDQTGGTPPETGYNAVGSPWRTIEEGLRLMGSSTAAFEAFQDSSALTPKLRGRFLASMRAQARHLMAHHSAAGNWLLMEMNGVHTFACHFPMLPESAAWRRESAAILAAALREQVLPDGLHYELSPDYHAVFYTCAAQMYARARKMGFACELPPDFASRLERGAEGYLAMMTPGFVQPRFNDCFTLKTSRVLETAARLFPKRRDFVWAATEGRGGTPPASIPSASRFLPYAGFAVMRSGWDRDATYLAFDVGPLGRGHWHQDKLSFTLWKGGEELVCDDGGGPYEQSDYRTYALSGYDHNTLLVDGLAQNRHDPKVSAAPIDASWVSTPERDFARGTYDQGFGPKELRLATHTREIEFRKPDLFRVTDRVRSADGQEHDYAILFQVDTTNVTLAADGRSLRARFGRTWDLAITVRKGGTLTCSSGITQPRLAGWFVGRNDLTIHPATTIFLKAPKSKDATFVTELAPISAATDDLEGFIRRSVAHGERTVLVPKGVYDLDPGTEASLCLSGLEGVTLDFQGSELRGRKKSGMLKLRDCRNVTIRNVTIDYPFNLPFTQGFIERVGTNGEWDVRIAQGYPDPQNGRWGWPVQAYDPKTGDLVNPMRYRNGIKVTRVAPGHYRVTGGQDRRGRVGDVAVWSLPCDTRNAAQSLDTCGHSVYLVNSSGCRLENVTVYSTPGSNGFREIMGSGNNIYERCALIPRPPETDPVTREIRRFRSGNHDAFNSRAVLCGPTLVACTARNQCDDAVNIHGPYQFIATAEGATVRAFVRDMYADALHVGDAVQFVTATGFSPDYTLRIVRIEAATPTTNEMAAVKKGLVDQIAHNCNTMRTVTFERADPILRPGTLFVSQNAAGNGFSLQRCTFGPNRARGFICNASYGEVLDCTFDRLQSYGILSRPSYCWLEGGAARDIRFENCTFRDCGVFFGVHPEMLTTNACHRKLTVSGCTFTGKKGRLEIQCCTGVALRGNTFELQEDKAVILRKVQTAGNPYGVCAHLSRPGEFATREAELAKMRKAGIGWCRTDFDWKYAEPTRGTWTFTHIDQLLKDAERFGIQILPILDYEVPWAPRPWDEASLPLWRDYVRRMVSHCRGRCPVWEVWNEENCTQSGAHPFPQPAEYVRLLKAAYEEIKAADPAARAAIGGFAGVPFDYIEKVYQAGGAQYFDIMNVHPYQHTDRAEGAFEDQFTRLRALMARYGDAAKPVWATEIGLETYKPALQTHDLIGPALNLIDAERKWRILYTAPASENLEPIRRTPALLQDMGITRATLDLCTFPELETKLATGGVDAILFPFTEEYPADAIDAVYDFVRAGGTLIDCGGMGLFKPVSWKGTGKPITGKTSDGAKDRALFRFENTCFYTDNRIPKTFPATPTPAYATVHAPVQPPPRKSPLTLWGEMRAFVPQALKPGDVFLPLLSCTTNGITASPLVLIRYNSDLKGNLILSGYFERGLHKLQEDDWQARGCARQLNEAYAMGYEKLFWYEFQQCSDFGIVKRNSFDPRPAYTAYRTFIRERPAGSISLGNDWMSTSGDVCCPHWQRPDGVRAGAVWSPTGRGQAPLYARNATAFTDSLGHPLPALPDPLPKTPVYFSSKRP